MSDAQYHLRGGDGERHLGYARDTWLTALTAIFSVVAIVAIVVFIFQADSVGRVAPTATAASPTSDLTCSRQTLDGLPCLVCGHESSNLYGGVLGIAIDCQWPAAVGRDK